MFTDSSAPELRSAYDPWRSGSLCEDDRWLSNPLRDKWISFVVPLLATLAAGGLAAAL